MVTKKTTKKPAKKVKETVAEKIEETKEVTTESNTMLYALILLGALIILVGVVYILMAPSDDSGSNDAIVIGAAVEQAKDAMSAVENKIGLTILHADPLVTNDGTSYLISFPIEGSINYTAFDVMLDMDLNLEYVGLDGQLKTPGNFLLDYVELTPYQKCAKLSNEQIFIPLINDYYVRNSRKRSILTIPSILVCNGVEYPYDLEISDGRVTTTIMVNGEGHYFTNNFKEGIIANTLKAPAEDISQGVFVYVDGAGENLIKLSYELKDKSEVAFDAYDMGLVEDYSIQVVPALVWNCKYVNAGTKATGELNGTFMPGSEDLALKTFGCIFNNGYPEDLCSSIGITRDENGSISTSISTEYYLTMYQTGLESCKPEGDVVKVEAFYPLDGCMDCENQRRVLSNVAKDFGEYMDLTYYCIGSADECQSFVNAR